MTRVEAVLCDVAAALTASGRRFALVGGLAVSARAEPRFTRDVDWAVAVTGDRDAEALLESLAAAGYDVVDTVEREAPRRLATARLLPMGESRAGVVSDLLFASSGIEPEVVAAAEHLELLPSILMPVATLGHLLALKVLAAAPERPQDAIDLRALVDYATPADYVLAQDALALIAARGFGRGKRLTDEYTRLVGAQPVLPPPGTRSAVTRP
jgi:predicted nucleotidyltransferase